jgi:2'-5' RNA ligase
VADQVRLFFAVNFSPEVKASIRRAIDDIGISNPPWRWVAEENVHLTLKFLGETPDDEIDTLSQCAEAVCRDAAQFRVHLGGLGGFPNLKRPRVLFFRIDEGVEPLRKLAEDLDRELARRLSIPREKRSFRAHATIARIKKPLRPDTVDLLSAAPDLQVHQDVQRMDLMRSQLGPKGSKYHCLKEFALSKPKC